jgi:transposase
MMGERTVLQEPLFFGFSLEWHVPADHMLRSIDRFVDLAGVRQHLAPFYSPIGRPSIDPELLIRMLLVGYCFGIRSERRLCEEVHLNLAYRWFCRLELDADVPDHSTFSKNRHGRFRESDLLRHLFETVVRRCMAEGLVGGEGFAVDASLIKADANRQRCVPGEEGLPAAATSRAIDEYLAVLDDAAFGAATPVTPKFISPADPASRWTGANGPGVLRLLHQLPDRPRSRRHSRRRAVHLGAPGRGHSRAHHDRARARAPRSVARTARRGHGLWVRRDARLAGP